MSTFTLAISCLTTSNLPWFMDITFQVPMQYCSLQHQTLLLSPVTSTAGYCFCFGSIPSFFLELFLHWSPVAYWAPEEFIFQCPIFLPFHTVHGILKVYLLIFKSQVPYLAFTKNLVFGALGVLFCFKLKKKLITESLCWYLQTPLLRVLPQKATFWLFRSVLPVQFSGCEEMMIVIMHKGWGQRGPLSDVFLSSLVLI